MRLEAEFEKDRPPLRGWTAVTASGVISRFGSSIANRDTAGQRLSGGNHPVQSPSEIFKARRRHDNGVAPPLHVFGDSQEAPARILLSNKGNWLPEGRRVAVAGGFMERAMRNSRVFVLLRAAGGLDSS